MNLKKLVEEKNICSLPWVHTDICLTNNRVTPCCKFEGNLGSTLQEFPIVWEKNFKKLREDLVNGVRVPECSACDVPDHVFSYKKWKHQSFTKGDFLEFDSENIQLPKVFTFTLKNICNLACRMCGPNHSSKLDAMTRKSTVLQKYYNIQNEINNKFDVNKFKGSFANVEQIAFGGGEPTMDDDCVKLVKLAKQESKNLKSVGLNTNLAIINDELLSELNDIDGFIYLKLSFDGPGKIHDYIRYKCNFDEVYNNIKYVGETYKNIKFSVNSNIQIFNVGYAIETMQTIHQIEKELNINIFQLTTVPIVNRPYLHPSILPDNIKKMYLDKLESNTFKTTIKDSEQYIPTAIAMLKEQPRGNIENFIEFTNEFDRMANTNICEVLPEFKSIFGA